MKFDGDYAVRSSFEVSQTSLIVPLTMAALAETIESVEHFQCRRLEWAGKELAAYEQPLLPWQILRIAGIGSVRRQRFQRYM